MRLAKERNVRLALPIILIALCLNACGDPDKGSQMISQNEKAVTASKPIDARFAGSQLWKGQPAGYVVQAASATDNVAFLASLGRVQAAIGRAGHYDKEQGMPNPFTEKLLAQYLLIDPYVTGMAGDNLSLEPLLSKVASPESFAVIVDNNRAVREPQNEIQVQLQTLTGRIDAIVTERFPSIRVSALAMSALYREAGELLMTGLSNDGQILDIRQYRDALQLMEASLRLRVNKAAACEQSRDAIDQLKSRGPLGDLLDRLIIKNDSGAVGANAGDVFEAAQQLEKLGKSLPQDDAKICT